MESCASSSEYAVNAASKLAMLMMYGSKWRKANVPYGRLFSCPFSRQATA